MKSKCNKIMIVFVACLLICIFICIYFSKYRLVSSFYWVYEEGISSQIRIIHISDLHNSEFGTDNQSLINKVKGQHPDLIFLTGDLIKYKEADLSVATNLIQKLKDIAPVYLSYGNHELDYEKLTGTDLKKVFEDAGAIVLEEECVDITINSQNIRIGGIYGYCLPDELSYRPEYTDGEGKFLEEFQDTENYKILLAHIPTPWLKYGFTECWDVDCVFTGHLHGGQIRIPFVGGLYGPDFGWFPGKLSGLYEMNDMHVVLSRGLGSSGHIPRFNNIPEIVVVDLIAE